MFDLKMTVSGDTEMVSRLENISSLISKDIPKMVGEEVEDLGATVTAGFQGAMYVGDNDVSVSVDGADNSWSITASGTSVLFIEYGSGIVFKHDSQFGDYGAYPARSWSAGHKQWLTNPKRLYRFQGWWPIAGIGWTQGNPSANVMYEASKTAKMKIVPDVRMALRKAIK